MKNIEFITKFRFGDPIPGGTCCNLPHARDFVLILIRIYSIRLKMINDMDLNNLYVRISLFYGNPDKSGSVYLNDTGKEDDKEDVQYRENQIRDYILTFNSLPPVGIRFNHPEHDAVVLNYISINPLENDIWCELYYE